MKENYGLLRRSWTYVQAGTNTRATGRCQSKIYHYTVTHADWFLKYTQFPTHNWIYNIVKNIIIGVTTAWMQH